VKLWDAKAHTPEQHLQREAGRLVNQLFAKLLFKEDVREELGRNASRSEPLRRTALSLVERHQADPARFRQASWAVVQKPGAGAAEYQLALRQARAGLDAASPKEWFYWNCLYTLGVAHYRVGQWQEALDALAKADSVYLAWYRKYQADYALPATATREFRPYPSAAFQAMAHYQLGHQEDARTILASLRETMKLPQWARNAQAQAFAREAEALIESKAPDPRK
jgi:hypothetical protein